MSWLRRTKEPAKAPAQNGVSQAVARRQEKQQPEPKPKPKDPNAPLRRLQLHQKCLYERVMPGDAFISAHVNRLQHGFYESSALHEPTMDNVYFVSVHFVFHPHDPRAHRFKSAVIKVSIHGEHDPAHGFEDRWYKPPKASPRILVHAPELIYGAVSPENLQWNFSLSSSLGVSQMPLSATVNPAGGVMSSYKVYDMMSIQGSLRSMQSPLGPKHDVEDGMAVWTLEENRLQRSGLPREFDFVLLVHKPDEVKNVYLSVDVDAVVENWFGQYPQWYTNLSKYLPSQDYTLDFNMDIGQRFLPVHPGRGFNFADLPHPLEEYVTMPGTVYPTNGTQTDAPAFRDPGQFGQLPPGNRPIEGATPTYPQQPGSYPGGYNGGVQNQSSSRHSWAPETLNVRVMLEHASPGSSSSRRYSLSPNSGQEPFRQPSIRRRRSRSGLKEYGAQQALKETIRDTPRENGKQAV